MVCIFVPDAPEFAPLVEAARALPDCRVNRHAGTYHRIESDGPLQFSRKALRVKPAVWYGLFTGGIDGEIQQFDREVVRIAPSKSAQGS